MTGERLKEMLDELRGLIEQAQAALDDRPVLQRVLTALREKVREVGDPDKSEGKDETEENKDGIEDKKE